MDRLLWLPRTLCCSVGLHPLCVDGLGIMYSETHCIHCAMEVCNSINTVNTEENYQVMRDQKEDPSSNWANLFAYMIFRPIAVLCAIVLAVSALVGFLYVVARL